MGASIPAAKRAFRIMREGPSASDIPSLARIPRSWLKRSSRPFVRNRLATRLRSSNRYRYRYRYKRRRPNLLQALRAKRRRRMIRSMLKPKLTDKTYARRNNNSGQFSVSANECAYDFTFWPNRTVLNAFADNLDVPTVDTTNNRPAFTTCDVLDPTQTHTAGATMLSGYYEIWLRNNAAIPVKLKMYRFVAADDMDTTGEELFDEGFLQKGISSWNTDVKLDLLDAYPFIKRYVRLVGRPKTYLLNAGDMTKFTIKFKRPYRIAADNEFEYFKWFSKLIALRLQGVPAHDSETTTNVGLGNGTLDWVSKWHFKAVAEPVNKYHRLESATSGLDTLTNPEVDAESFAEDVKEDL